MPRKKTTRRPKQTTDPTSCSFHGLRRASPRRVHAQAVEYWDRAGGFPKPTFPGRERLVCRNLTFSQACGYLSMVNQRLLEAGGITSLYVVPFVVAWWTDGEDGEALGFPIEVWMTRASDDRGCSLGLWDIVDRSNNLYRLPWLGGRGWIADKLPGLANYWPEDEEL